MVAPSCALETKIDFKIVKMVGFIIIEFKFILKKKIENCTFYVKLVPLGKYKGVDQSAKQKILQKTLLDILLFC
jgi:hypothetical protein